ncbi:tripartite tricarboxylate transporter substrate binding protein [Variovorax saccharolyticus]|uniref:tripartite tricarboxylate transporter substrate binding protein n=1 Tax=Variovorax saccharolyticus TaxID=3053516 RepID=UPI002577A0D7|nr:MULTISPECIES: tripartite tricarboxylate transporter substrate binding protein [unclassified Variovorax]MDM0022400.1 tripartite tricarboxylate transporter substrate binding protein [Variovorax sp. J22R187]MDM0029056.1 tripartite tricarboxylate transporter substrate binding protein [Variovorax sp. J31P216]
MRNFGRVKLSTWLLAAMPLALAGSNAGAQSTYPAQPIKMMVGFAPGSATDVLSRVVAQGLSERMGQPVVVDNKSGAGGSLAADAVAKSKPDGHTLLFVSSAIAVNPAVYPKLTFDVNADLTPISLVGRAPLVMLVNQSVGVKNLSEFIAKAKTKPGALNFGSSGQGGAAHMATELFSMTAEVKLVHVPYRGNSQAITALLGGDVDLMMDTLINALPQLKSPKIHPLAITGDARSALAPDVPTFREMGLPQFDTRVMFGVMGPANMPKTMVDRINKEIAATLKSKDVASRLSEAGGLTLDGGSPEEFRLTLRKELAMWKKVAAEAKVVADQ